jgi:hypothetical protein
VRDVMVAETGSLGVRATTWRRWPQQRTDGVVEVDGHPVRVKVGPYRAKVEHDDAVAVARATGRPLQDVVALAERAYAASAAESLRQSER